MQIWVGSLRITMQVDCTGVGSTLEAGDVDGYERLTPC